MGMSLTKLECESGFCSRDNDWKVVYKEVIAEGAGADEDFERG